MAYAAAIIMYHVTNFSDAIGHILLACVKSEHVLFLLRAQFWTLRCVRIRLEIGRYRRQHFPQCLQQCLLFDFKQA